MKFLKRWQKKGSIFDALALIIVPVVFLFILIAFFFIYTQTKIGLEDTADMLNSENFNNSIEPISANADRYSNFWDPLGIFLIFGMWLVVLATSFILGNNPIFLIFYIMSSFALVVTSLIFQVVFDNVLSNPSMSDFFLNFPMMTFFVSNFFPFALLFVVSVAIALYLKPS